MTGTRGHGLIAETACIHPTAIVEDGVSIGPGTSVWDSCHIRGPETSIGRDCIIGEKTYVAYGVSIGDRCKLNAFVYVCNAVTIETGVMIAAGVTFTNDRFPRACTPDLSELRSSAPDEHTYPTLVRGGATIGARAVIGCDVTIGRFAMVGMGAIVTKSVPAHHLVVGQPARTIGLICCCGQPLLRGVPDATITLTCAQCGERYKPTAGGLIETS